MAFQKKSHDGINASNATVYTSNLHQCVKNCIFGTKRSRLQPPLDLVDLTLDHELKQITDEEPDHGPVVHGRTRESGITLRIGRRDEDFQPVSNQASTLPNIRRAGEITTHRLLVDKFTLHYATLPWRTKRELNEFSSTG